jgi:hypothetical protein
MRLMDIPCRLVCKVETYGSFYCSQVNYYIMHLYREWICVGLSNYLHFLKDPQKCQ